MVEETVTEVEPSACDSEIPAKILIVDDDKSQVAALEYRLRQQGYQTSSAYSGQEALGRARNELPSLILLDLRLPDMAGLEVCAELADSPDTCGIPIIIISGMERPDIVRSARAAGGEYFIRKPYDPNVLLTLIEQSIRRQPFDW